MVENIIWNILTFIYLSNFIYNNYGKNIFNENLQFPFSGEEQNIIQMRVQVEKDVREKQ